MPKKQTKEEFIQKSKNIFGDNLDYSLVQYVNASTKVVLICKKHGNFLIAPKDHICYKIGCSICSGSKYNKETFVAAAIKVHGNLFDYSKIIYTGIKNKIIIICKIHGEFKQTPDKHINSKQGCPKCKLNSRKDLEYFLKKSLEIHGNKYNYSKVIFTKMFDNVEIICPNHGSFWQLPSNHINNKMGCQKCEWEKSRITLKEFIERSKTVHKDNEYDYSKSIYVNCVTKIEIICKKHGSFWQTPVSHMSGANCPWCVGRNSQKEKLWLDFLCIPEEFRNKTLYNKNKHYRVDAYNPITNTIYEFYGDYWHGNPNVYNPNFTNKHNKQTFEKLYSATIKREKELINLGYNISSVWEYDFNQIDKRKR